MTGGSLFVRWLLANVVGCVAGSLLGATNDGVIVAMVPGLPGRLIGDLVFGACVGAAQWFALRVSPTRAVTTVWIGAMSVGFLVGARAGARIAPALAATLGLPLSTAFGLIMGGSLGLATTWAFRHRLTPATAGVWLAVNMLAWATGEAVAFAAGFSQFYIPLLAIAIGGITWPGVEIVHRRRRA